jgi:hypothetical protein
MLDPRRYGGVSSKEQKGFFLTLSASCCERGPRMSDSPKQDGSEGRDYPADPTIVGGRPLGSGRPRQGIPRGIEVLVKKASVDSTFRQVLLEKRAAAATEIGLELSATEADMLKSVPRSQIEQIIENTTVPDEHRRVFLGKIAASMLAVLGFGLSSRDSEAEAAEPRRLGGIRPDYSTTRVPAPQGIRPDDPRRKPSLPSDPNKSPDGQRPVGSDARSDQSKDKGPDKGNQK